MNIALRLERAGKSHASLPAAAERPWRPPNSGTVDPDGGGSAKTLSRSRSHKSPGNAKVKTWAMIIPSQLNSRVSCIICDKERSRN